MDQTLMSFDVQSLRKEFPALERMVNNRPLVYLDNAATTLKPKSVIQAIHEYYERYPANVHRGVHTLSQEATHRYEQARVKVQHFLNAASPAEIIFTKGTTEAINLVASSLARSQHLGPDDEILVTEMEHHSNIVPWQMLRDTVGCRLVVVPFNERGEIALGDVAARLTDRTKLVSIVALSNSLGTINPIADIVRMAHEKGVPVLIDAAQAAAHMILDVQALDCDFLVFSGHKIYGPTGVGVLYGKAEWLNRMPPYQGGGDMILSVTFEKTTYNILPHKFEAGTPPIAEVIGLGAAIDFLSQLDREALYQHEQEVLRYAHDKLSKIEGLRIYGTAEHKAAVISFNIAGIHAHDLGTLVDEDGVAIRTGHHCTQPVMAHFGVAAMARASLGLYNTIEDIDRLAHALIKAKELFPT